MAASDYAIIPKLLSKTATTSAQAVYSATLLVPAAIISANGANTGRVYIGDSTVAANKGLALSAREALTLDPFKRSSEQSSYYDLNKFFVRATAASQVITIMILDRGRDNA